MNSDFHEDNRKPALESCVMPIYGFDEKSRPEVVGSGTLIAIGPQRYLVSAAHVIEQHGIHYAPSPGKLFDCVATITSLSRSGNRKDDRNDLGFMELSADIANEIGRQFGFVPMGLIDPNDMQTSTANYEFFGFPASKARVDISKKRIRLKPYLVRSSTVSPEQFSELGLQTFSHIAVYFDREEAWTFSGEKQLAPEVYGMSGGAVWRVWRSGGIADNGPVKRLVGIGIETWLKSKALVGVRISAVLEAIRRKKPELSAFIPKTHSIDFEMTFDT